jgi:hypothetical protein
MPPGGVDGAAPPPDLGPAPVRARGHEKTSTMSPEPGPAPAAGACPNSGRRVELRVAGHLSERASGAFGQHRVVCAGSETAIRGVLADPSHLHELLARCRSLGLQVISLRRLPQ